MGTERSQSKAEVEASRSAGFWGWLGRPLIQDPPGASLAWRLVPSKVSIRDLDRRAREVEVLQPTHPARRSLPAGALKDLDAFDAHLRPTGTFWQRAKVLWPLLVGVFVFSVWALNYAGFPRRAIIAVLTVAPLAGLVGAFGIAVPLVWYLRGRRYAAAHGTALLSHGHCPWCLRSTTAVKEEREESVRCACGGHWPTLGSMQVGTKRLGDATAEDRRAIALHTIGWGMGSLVTGLSARVSPTHTAVMGIGAFAFVSLFFGTYSCFKRPQLTRYLPFAFGGPAILVAVHDAIRHGAISVPLLAGGSALGVLMYLLGRAVAPRTMPLGWSVARYVCASCGYDLRGHARPGPCPECGAEL